MRVVAAKTKGSNMPEWPQDVFSTVYHETFDLKVEVRPV